MDVKTDLKSRLPSRHATEGPERAPHRAFYYAMGLSREQIHQPFVGVATCWNEAAPCNIALMRQAQADGRIAGVPYDPAALVWTAWDLGIRDATAIWFALRGARR